MALREHLDRILEPFGLYAAYSLSETEYIGELDLEAVHDLDKIGYEPTNPLLEALKYHWETGEKHDWSKRKVDPHNPKYQFHIHGWHNNESWSVASHWELRPDVRLIEGETPGEAINRLRRHYRPHYYDGENDTVATYYQGKACPELAALV